MNDNPMNGSGEDWLGKGFFAVFAFCLVVFVSVLAFRLVYSAFDEDECNCDEVVMEEMVEENPACLPPATTNQ